MENSLQYETFRDLTLPARIEWFDQHSPEYLAEHFDKPGLKKFLGKLLEDESNTYLQQKAVEYIGELALLGVLRLEFAKDCMLDMPTAVKNTYVLIARLKYLFLLYGNDSEVIALLLQETGNEDAELAAEASYLLGLSYLLYHQDVESEAAAIVALDKANSWFNQAQFQTENRIDARFFSAVCSFLLQLLGEQLLLAQQTFALLSQILWERQLWGWSSPSELLEHLIFQGLQSLKAIAENTASEQYWTDYRKEFSVLALSLQELLITDSVARRYKSAYQHFSQHTVAAVLDQYYLNNLSGCRSKINALLETAHPADTLLQGFLIDLKSRLDKDHSHSALNPTRIVAALHRVFPEITLARLEQDVKELAAQGKEELRIETELFQKYLSHSRIDRTSYVTGYPKSDEVLELLIRNLKHLLPNYPPHKKAVFVSLLSDILRYAYQSIIQPKEQFSHLYDSSVKAESAFQKHLFMRLTQGERATYYHYEESDVLGASRIDIVYRENGLTFPVEIKKTETKTDWITIQNSYVTQIQTYAHPYDQLGILVVFDISDKNSGGPINDFSSLVNILHVEPYYNIQEKHPDYVVAVLIPGNKISPSRYTSY